MKSFHGVMALVLLSGVSLLAADAGGVTVSGSSSSSTGFGGSSSGSYSSTGISVGGHGSKRGDMDRASGRYHTDSNGERSIAARTGDYFRHRLYDLADIIDFSFGAGPGFMVNVHATKLAQAVGGWGSAYHVGFRGRSAGMWKEARTEVGVSLLYYQRIERERISGWVENFRTDKMDLDTAQIYQNNADRSFLGIGAQVQAGVMLNVNVRPMQAVDFVLGWFTIDVLEDDTGKLRRNKDL